MEITQVWTPYDIAQALLKNQTQHERGEIDFAAWFTQQRVLWNIAANKHCVATVQRLCVPSVFA